MFNTVVSHKGKVSLVKNSNKEETFEIVFIMTGNHQMETRVLEDITQRIETTLTSLYDYKIQTKKKK